MRSSKLLPAAHSGRVRHHRHTSYGSLVVVLVLAFGVVIAACHSLVVAADATDPVTSSEGVYAVVPGAVPASAPVITNISPGAVFATSDTIPAVGTCPSGTVVKLFKNDVFTGAGLCQGSHFSISFNLFPGPNSLSATAYNLNDVAGPASDSITVQNSIAGAPGSATTGGSGQFFITSSRYYQGVDAGKALTWSLTISGGVAPYAVNVGWGDGKTTLVSRGNAEPFTIQHTYDKPGQGAQHGYDVTVQATDQVGEQSFVQLVAIVNGSSTSVVGSIRGGYHLSQTVRIAILTITGAALFCLAFWLGERRELFIIRRTGMRSA